MRISAIFIFLLFIHTVFASSPKREMRGVWVSTVTNIDFPKQLNASVEEQKKEIRELLDQHQADGINAVFFQVRPTADAFYLSDIEPWSRYLNGEQGKAPDPLYDPLCYFIEEAHKRNMELHAWVNPFRVRLHTTDVLTPDHSYNKNKWWGWDYKDRTYFDPGIPEVRQYCENVILDIVSRYDVDGIHFDDYFYPYRTNADGELPDIVSFQQYGGDYYPDKKDDWRRENINTFIEKVSKSIKATKPWVKFGISPFGIWKNSSSPDDGLPTCGGLSSYETLYADAIKWLKEGWIDYCTPQIYWSIGYATADYSKLLQWWSEHSYGRKLYVGHSLFKIDESSKIEAWRNSVEIEHQIEALRKNVNISGSVFYSSRHLVQREDLSFLHKALQEKYYKNYALMPTMPWIDDKAPVSPRAVKFVSSGRGNAIRWEMPKYKNQMDKAYRYVIYKVESKKEKKQLTADNIVAITRDTTYYLPLESRGGYYIVTALDRLQNESKPKHIIIRQEQLLSVVFFKGEPLEIERDEDYNSKIEIVAPN